MANYVYNYIYCDRIAKEKLISSDSEYSQIISDREIVISKDNDIFLVIFSTCGTEYKKVIIEKFIDAFRDCRWLCVEENELEEVEFYWDGEGVSLKTREMIDYLPGREICYKESDTEGRPLRKILFSDRQMIIENFYENSSNRHEFHEESISSIRKYISKALNEFSGNNIEYSIPNKNEIAKDMTIQWDDKDIQFSSHGENDTYLINYPEGEGYFEKIISTMEYIIAAEGISLWKVETKFLNN